MVKAFANMEGFCDELLDMAINYWSTDNSPDNTERMSVLEQKISAHITMIWAFVEDNFTKTDHVRFIMKTMSNEITGGSFGGDAKKADREKVKKSVDAIVELRRAIRKSVYAGK